MHVNRTTKETKKDYMYYCAEENTREGLLMVTSSLHIETQIRLELQVDEVCR